MVRPPVASRTRSGKSRQRATLPRPSCRNTNGGNPSVPSTAGSSRYSTAPPISISAVFAVTFVMQVGSRRRGRRRFMLQLAPQGEALDLSRRRLRQGIDDDDLPRPLEGGHALATVGIDVSWINGATTARDEKGDRRLQTGRRKRAHDGGFENVGMLNKYAFDFRRRHPDAADLHHVVVAAKELVVAVVGARVHVTRAQP